jgi:ABC-type uncharacterized transport system auxiliary subunit
MSTMRRVRWLVVCAALGLTACALMRAPQALTTLQLQLADDARAWPEQIEPKVTRASAALQSTRVLVFDGALLMQHGGLRWVDAPAKMLDEQLRLLRYAHPGNDVATMASVELWLTQFNIRIAASGEKSVEVAALAELQCAGDASLQRMPLAEASVALTGEDAAVVAAAFAAATDRVVAAIGSAASKQAESCASG